MPSRLEEGHGLSLAALDAAERGGATVIITVDCGTTSHAEIAAANDAASTSSSPTTTASRRSCRPPWPWSTRIGPTATYPDRRLAGSGVAFKVAQALLAELPGGPAAALDLADLATIGTVADVAPIVGENRAIARLGLERIRRAPRPGIAALLARARIDPAAADLETISFAIAPRLNAAGRVGEAVEAARLLLAEDAATAEIHADALEAANLERRDLLKRSLVEAQAVVEASADRAFPSATVIRGPWNVGIIGLIAARLADEHGRPAVVGAEIGDTVRASCRSDGSLDLGATLERCADLFTRFGGHAGAAGFELPADRWDAFRERFLGLADERAPRDPRLPLAIDLALPALDVDYAPVARTRQPRPGRPGQSRTRSLVVTGMTVTRVRAATGGHSQLTLRRTSTSSTASRSVARISPRPSTRATAWMSSRAS